MLTVVTPANDYHLLTVDERRRAARVIGGSADIALEAMSLQASAIIASLCKMPRAGVSVPTLLRETFSETIRPVHFQEHLILGRRFVTSVASVTVNGIALVVADYEIASSEGVLYRLSGNERRGWDCTKTVVQFVAGFVDIPYDLKMAAAKLVSGAYTAMVQDPALKREYVIGVGEYEYFGGLRGEAAIPPEVKHVLMPYIYRAQGRT